ncbi:SixA phosphatase family protein [Nitratifractor sp.]
MKRLYLVRNAKSRWNDPGAGDFERELRPKGKKELRTIASYLRLRGILPDLMLSSCALRAQQTCDLLAEELGFDGPRHYLDELYMRPSEAILDLIAAQGEETETLFVVGHTPQLHELAHRLTGELIRIYPPMGVVAIECEAESWSELHHSGGKLDFFIHPKQFKYYIPAQIRAHLPR